MVHLEEEEPVADWHVGFVVACDHCCHRICIPHADLTARTDSGVVHRKFIPEVYRWPGISCGLYTVLFLKNI